MNETAKVLTKNQNGELFILGEVNIRLEPKYANGRYHIRDVVHYDSYLLLSEEVDKEEIRKNIRDGNSIITIYYCSQKEKIRKCVARLRYETFIKLEQIGNYIPIFESENIELLEVLEK